MLAKSIAYLMIFGFISSLISCGASASPLLYERTAATISQSLFCKKYLCKLDLNSEDSKSVVYDIVVKSTIYETINTQIEISLSDQGISELTIHLGLDYPNNKLYPAYANLIEDFHIMATGESIINAKEYFYGGKITKCYDNLYFRQIKDNSIIRSAVSSSSKTSKVPYITYCNQYFLGPKISSNRFLTIARK
ncbi:hypothetical protein K7W42_17600 [Deinococcus sp. HMF7604]|uniref:hypothetical protein n=1 Tax=Deinococcus betulae TaxID=2873312 RepID=UPI001CCF689C|nr:hypothetical protein [Deinococcus betulae]MBZ9752661.1 hypothetical protein [Deinococcus betulae]